MAQGVRLIQKARRIDVSAVCGLNCAVVTESSRCMELGHRRGHCGSLLSVHYRISAFYLLEYDMAG